MDFSTSLTTRSPTSSTALLNTTTQSGQQTGSISMSTGTIQITQNSAQSDLTIDISPVTTQISQLTPQNNFVPFSQLQVQKNSLQGSLLLSNIMATDFLKVSSEESEVGKWLSTLDKNFDNASVTKLLENSGKNNKGVFEVVTQGKERYFVKIPNGIPASIFKELEAKNEEIAEKELKHADDSDFPNFAKLIASEKGKDGKMGLFEAAPGSSLERLHDRWVEGSGEEDMNQIYQIVGASMGSLHFGAGAKSKNLMSNSNSQPAYTHGDANPSNIFVDLQQSERRMTLIDNNDLNFKSGRIDGALNYEAFSSTLMNFKEETFSEAGVEYKESNDTDLTAKEKRVQAELGMLCSFTSAYLMKAPEGTICGAVIKEVNKKLENFLGHYSKASGLSKEEALERIPAFQPMK